MRADLKPLRAFLWERMYNHPSIAERMALGKRAIRALCNALERSPTEEVLRLRERTGSGLPDAVKDHVAGMTDAHATREAARLA